MMTQEETISDLEEMNLRLRVEIRRLKDEQADVKRLLTRWAAFDLIPAMGNQQEQENFDKLLDDTDKLLGYK